MEEEKEKESQAITRRQALKYMAIGGASLVGACYGLKGINLMAQPLQGVPFLAPDGKIMCRKDSKSGNSVSLLGYGCMRFPSNRRAVDREKTQELIDYAIQRGVNYFDTAYVYHQGKSEEIIGQCLKKYPRNSYFLADKMPGWVVKSLEDGKRVFQEQLDRCGVQYFDYYLCHSLGDSKEYDRIYEDTGLYNYLKEEQKKGRIRQLGFSFHGSPNQLEYLVNKHDWDFVQIQYNYFDYEDARQQAAQQMKILQAKNLPAIIMEPLRGGALAKLNKGCEKQLGTTSGNVSLASWAMRFAGTPSNVLTVLSGMTLMEHVVDNANTFTNFKPLTKKEEQLLLSVVRSYKQNKPIGCTACNYCMPCEYGVEIPTVFAVYNESANELSLPNPEGPHDKEYNKKKRAFLNSYRNRLDDKGMAHRCIDCGRCAKLCPQKINIPKEMQRIDDLINELEGA